MSTPHGLYHQPSYPFTAIVGQDRLKLALVLTTVNPLLGGLLIRGHKGTGKSTAARALSDLLPSIEIVSGCRFLCDPFDASFLCEECRKKVSAGVDLQVEAKRVPFVDLPLNATEDRVVGSIDFEHALRSGSARFQPGLLAAANRGFLYIDEVNLLEDHLVDVLLDAAASGINVAQREGVGFVHPSRFVLVASMNPEEGEIRPQLLDRFGLCVEISGLFDPERRVEILRRRERFETDPDGFQDLWSSEQNLLRRKIESARGRLGRVAIDADLLREIADVCVDHRTSGHRAEILIAKVARTLASLDERSSVCRRDVREATRFVLPHRTRDAGVSTFRTQRTSPVPGRDEGDQGIPTSGPSDSDARRPLQRFAPNADGVGITVVRNGGFPTDGFVDPPAGRDSFSSQADDASARRFDIGAPVSISAGDIQFARKNIERRSGRRRTTVSTSQKTGRYVRSTAYRTNTDIALDATLRAAAPFQKRRPPSEMAVCIRDSDIRGKIRKNKASALLVFVVDASGSMGTRLVREAKSTILALLLEAYQKRDRVCMVAFRGTSSAVVLPPTNSVELASRLLESLPTGGKTPLGLGLLSAYRLIASQLRRDPSVCPLLVLITDGRANVGMDRARVYEGPAFRLIQTEIAHICGLVRSESRIRSLVIDAEIKGFGNFDAAVRLAEHLKAKYYRLEDIARTDIVTTLNRESSYLVFR